MRDDKEPSSPPALPLREGLLRRFVTDLTRRAFGWINETVIPVEFGADAERARRARLVTGFGVLGLLFGAGFATFYFFIGHYWGTGIIVVCTAEVTLAPFLMRFKKAPETAGNILLLILTLGFTGLCLVEGGLHGHAIAWLVSVPLCALLLTGRRASIAWIFAAFLAAGFIVAVDTVPRLAGLRLPLDYDEKKWNTIVCATGYMGLILFMSLLGHIFERGRTRAFAKKQEALAELAAMNERLVHLNKEKNVFLGIAAHDLKNPLTAIMANAELLKIVNDEPGQVIRFAADIVAASTRMRDLITDLLDANAIEEGRFTSDLQPCDVSAMVERSAENYRFAAGKKQIDIHVSASRGLRAKADPKAMMQILDNLVSNAVKYSPPKTTVSVRTFPESDHVLIAVKDEGPGVSEEDQKKLFGKFTRLSARPTGGESSTGLGLSIVKHLVEAMAGTIQCQAVLGLGATFTLKLPLWTAADDAKVEPKSPPAAHPGSRLTFRQPSVLN
jgi:signal transduction histidine kinase